MPSPLPDATARETDTLTKQAEDAALVAFKACYGITALREMRDVLAIGARTKFELDTFKLREAINTAAREAVTVARKEWDAAALAPRVAALSDGEKLTNEEIFRVWEEMCDYTAKTLNFPKDAATLRDLAREKMNLSIPEFARRIRALGSRVSGDGERALVEAKREGALDMIAFLRGISPHTRTADWDISHRQHERGIEYLAATYPSAERCECRLSDGRVFERGDGHAGFDIVRNKGKQGCESRDSFKSAEQLRERFRATHADWRLIDDYLAALTPERAG